MKSLSVIIVTYNSSAIISDALRSIQEYNDIGQELEVIIVDNASSDFDLLRQEVQRFSIKGLRIIRAKENGGYGSGNNLGVSKAFAPYILILNPDVRLYKPIFSDIITALDKDCRLGILGLKQFESVTPVIPNPSFIIKQPTLKHLFLHKIFVKLDVFSDKFFTFSGACFAVRKASFLEAGGFNEDLFLYWEEADLQHRLMTKATAKKNLYARELGYIHRTHGRDLSLTSHMQGVNSYVKFSEYQGIPKTEALIRIKSFFNSLSFILRFRDKNIGKFYTSVVDEISKLQANDL